MRTTLGRGSAYALTSLCVSSMVSYNLVRNTKRGFHLSSIRARPPSGDTVRTLARL